MAGGEVIASVATPICDATINVSSSFPTVYFGTDDVIVGSNKSCRCHLDKGVVVVGVSDWSAVDLFFSIAIVQEKEKLREKERY